LTAASNRRVVSGMRPTGKLHLGHYYGVLKNWLALQFEYECLFFAADWHALTTEYERPECIAENVNDMVIDWLAAGIDPGNTRLFVQSHVPEHAELHLLLSMLTPLGWLERIPSYKEQQEKLPGRDLSTYGFLGYPLLQAADIIVYKAGRVPVGADQVAHVEMAREVARRFNHLYGREPDFEQKAEAAAARMGKKKHQIYNELRRQYQERGDADALQKAHALIESQQNLSLRNQERLEGYLEGGGRMFFPEPQALLTKTPCIPGLNGQKMSKSHDNTIGLREAPDDVAKKLRIMPTDPARIRRSDPGDPEKCPVWELHKIFSDRETHQWVQEGCRNASIGCLDCNQRLTDRVQDELAPIRERGQEYAQDPTAIQRILEEGREHARTIARATLREVREAAGLDRH